MSKKTKKSGMEFTGEFRLIDKSKLIVDPSYQRSFARSKKFKEMVDDFKWPPFGAVSVSRRGSKFYVIDGQHRVEAAKQIDDITLVPCILFTHLTKEQEALYFVDVNDRRKGINAADKFKAKITAGDEDALEIQRIVDVTGWTIAVSGPPMTMRCIRALEWCYERYGSIVTEAVLEFIACKHDGMIHQATLKGLCAVEASLRITGYGTLSDYERNIADYRTCIAKIGNDKSLAMSLGSSDLLTVPARVFMAMINKNRRNKVPLELSRKKIFQPIEE